jgi:hypothetical protein
MAGEKETAASFSVFSGPRPGEILAAQGAEDSTPEGSAFLDLVVGEEEAMAAAYRSLLENAPDHGGEERGSTLGSHRALRDKLGTMLSLMDRLGSCWWGCGHGDHTVQYSVAASESNALCALRLLRSGYYDEPLGLTRQIAERANLLELFLLEPGSLDDWAGAGERERQKRFSAFNVRMRLERSGIPPVVTKDHYAFLSAFGIHPGRIPQQFGEHFPPTIGTALRWRGILTVLRDLSFAVAMVGETGAALLSDDDRIPGGKIIQTAKGLLDEQRQLSKVVDDWLGQDPPDPDRDDRETSAGDTA